MRFSIKTSLKKGDEMKYKDISFELNYDSKKSKNKEKKYNIKSIIPYTLFIVIFIVLVFTYKTDKETHEAIKTATSVSASVLCKK